MSTPSPVSWAELSTVTAKEHVSGTHRVVDPAATLRRMHPLMPMMGITRIANVTGLDRIGVPVAVACRPNSRSLSVSQGKGLTLDASKASALMESIEAWHAERIELPLRLGSVEDLRYTLPLADVDGLPRLASSTFHPLAPLLWIEGLDLLDGVSRWVPYELVHTNYTLPLPSGSGCFAPTSNGLASGNHVLEATSHAICEVVERDAVALWQLRASRRSSTRNGDGGDERLDLASVDDADCREVIERFERAGVSVTVWDITSDVRIAAFACLISEAEDPLHPLYSALGMGCHPAREIALLRALTEAAQSRLTVISGARDDVSRLDYERTRSPDFLSRDRAIHAGSEGRRIFADVPTLCASTLNEDLEWELDQLREAVEQVIVVDLTRDDLQIPVVRVVIPGLEGVKQMAGYVPGRRGRAVLAARDDGSLR